ncbi:MAG: DUF4446 family protein [Mycobacteriales bacterium]|nr:DUF4446 family protein [Frankia sp.]
MVDGDAVAHSYTRRAPGSGDAVDEARGLLLLDPDTADTVAVAAAATAGVALLLSATAQVRLSRMRRAYGVLQGGRGQDDFVTAVNRHVAAVGDLRGEVGQIQQAVRAIRTDLSDAIRHVAVVRYDAFQEMGGRLSFSAALLDDSGDGVVLTSINGRSETRTYAKGVKAGKSDQPLSPEEEQAIGFASRGGPPADRRPR